MGVPVGDPLGCFRNNKTTKSSLVRNSFFVRITSLWNAMPIAIRSEVRLASFKNKLKSYFYERLRSVFHHDGISLFKVPPLKYFCTLFLLALFFWNIYFFLFSLLFILGFKGMGHRFFRGMMWLWVHLVGDLVFFCELTCRRANL